MKRSELVSIIIIIIIIIIIAVDVVVAMGNTFMRFYGQWTAWVKNTFF